MKSLSRVRLFATPWTAAHQAPPSMGFAKHEYWSGVPFPSPSLAAAAAAAAAKLLQSYPTPCDPIDGSPPGFPVAGILQARTLARGLSILFIFSEKQLLISLTFSIVLFVSISFLL